MANQKNSTKKKSSSSTKSTSSAPRKNTSTGSQTTTKKKNTAVYRTQKGHRTAPRSSPQRRQRTALILFVVSLFLLFITLIPGESVWLALHNTLLGLFGPIAYLWPVLLIYIAFSIAFEKSICNVKGKLWLSMALISICAVLYFLFGGYMSDVSFGCQLMRLFANGYSENGPGLISGLIGIPFVKLFGMVGAKIFAVLMAFLVLMLLTGTGLVQLIRWISAPAKVVKKTATVLIEDAAAAAQEAQQRRSNRRASIDIPLDEEGETRTSENLKKNQKFAQLTEAVENANQPETGREKKKQNTPINEIISELPEEQGIPEPPPAAAELVEMMGEEILDEPDEPAEDMSDVLKAIKMLENPEPVRKQLKDAEEAVKTPESVEEKKPENNSAAVEAPGDEAEPIDPNQMMIIPEPEQCYRFPPVTLLEEDKAPANGGDGAAALQATGERLISTLKSFGVSASILNISKGPTVTRYELQPAAGVKISRITNLADDIALNLAAGGVRIEAPIPNKAAIGIEVPNRQTSTVHLRGLVDSTVFAQAKSRLTVALGKDIAGNITLADLAKMPHLLIAGSTGSGKSVCINTMIVSLLYKSTPDEVRFLMIDPKVVELGVYNGIPHLLVPVVTDPRKAAGALNWAVGEMLARYKTFASTGVRDLASYNHYVEQKQKEDPACDVKPMPQIVIIVDELADLMMAAPNEVEDAICRLAQMARAAGMHLVIATQRPSVDVITGVIKANIPSRIAFAVSSQVDSRTILDASGAEKLLGRGDMLFAPIGSNKPTRVQGCFVSEEEIEQVIDFIKKSAACEYDSDVANEIERRAVPEKNGRDSDESHEEHDETDPMLDEAVRCVSEAGQASTSLLQRKLRLGYARAGRLIDEMEVRGIVGPHEGSKPRQVLMSYAQWMDKKQASESLPEEIM